MFRYLNRAELESLKKRLCYLATYKSIYIDKNVNKFYNMELSLEKAIKVYGKLLNLSYYTYENTEKIDNIMREYLKEDENVTTFLNTCENYCMMYDPDYDNYCDTAYDMLEDLYPIIHEFISKLLGKYYFIDIKNIYDILYSFNEEDVFDEKEKKLWKNYRKDLVDTFAIDEDMPPDYKYSCEFNTKNLPLENISDMLRTELTAIAISNVKACEKNLNLYKMFHRTISARPYGGAYSSLGYDNDNNVILDLADEDFINAPMSCFIVIAINIYKMKKDADNN